MKKITERVQSVTTVSFTEAVKIRGEIERSMPRQMELGTYITTHFFQSVKKGVTRGKV